MNSNQILVRNITHLTDARYFAAMGVDWMSMVLTEEQDTFARWHALRDWVAGVKLLAEVRSGNEDLLAKVIIDAKPDGLLLPKNLQMEIPNEVEIFEEGPVAANNRIQIIQYESLDDLNFNEEETQSVFLQAPWTLPLLNEVLSSGFKGGICFFGGKEEAVGVRDYADLDDMINLIKER